MVANSTLLAFNSTALSIVNLSQSVAALLGNPLAFNTTYASTLITTIQLIANDVSSLPLTVVQRNEILNLLNLAITIINQAVAAGFITIEQINSLLNILELAVQKLNAFSFPLLFSPLQKGTFTCRQFC
jgi:hypothetical protein